jgi:hypothetical protein
MKEGEAVKSLSFSRRAESGLQQERKINFSLKEQETKLLSVN